ncbi:hypothetical protein FSP39_009756 [Pinctada imbricata]|uniref:Uncharacterized protein n=1 Tax=Pinctada imbricata TaxID=66713 RepID=A0AA89C753_PINIB|nr:hypothetical protein FSP39_009756 [Pinctada imbricata]
MTDEEKARKATREKDKGNEAFRSGDYKEAIAYYTRSIQLQSNAASFNNRALAYLKEKEWMRAETDCNKVLTLEPDNIKALLRRGSAYKGKKEYSKALVDFQRVLELEPANKRAEELIEELKKDEKKYEREKEEKKEKGKRMVIEETDGSDDESGDEIIIDKVKHINDGFKVLLRFNGDINIIFVNRPNQY